MSASAVALSSPLFSLPSRSTRTTVECTYHAPDKSWRVTFAPNGKLFALLKFDAAETLAGILQQAAKRSASGIDDVPTLLAKSRGQVASHGGRVLVTVDIGHVASYAPEDAMHLASKVYSCAQLAKREHWRRIDKFHTGGVEVKAVASPTGPIPVCTSEQEYERLGDDFT